MPQLNSEFFGLVWFGFLFSFLFFYNLIYFSFSSIVSLGLLTRNFFFLQIYNLLSGLHLKADIEIEFMTFFFTDLMNLMSMFYMFFVDLCNKVLFCKWLGNFFFSVFTKHYMIMNIFFYSFELYNFMLKSLESQLND